MKQIITIFAILLCMTFYSSAQSSSTGKLYSFAVFLDSETGDYIITNVFEIDKASCGYSTYELGKQVLSSVKDDYSKASKPIGGGYEGVYAPFSNRSDASDKRSKAINDLQERVNKKKYDAYNNSPSKCKVHTYTVSSSYNCN